MSPSTSTSGNVRPVTFADLGVRRVINCRGTYTILSGSRLLPEVAEAMAAASDAYIHMDELMERVGIRLAELTGAEWGYITCGCAAALSQLAAACMAGADPEKMARLPDTTGMPDEIIFQRAHHNTYDRALRLAGGRMVEVDTEAELRAALSPRTALIAINADYERPETFPLERMIAVARERGIPCIVDAAAHRLDVPNSFLALGADAVLYSGGKCLRGPQASGLVLGRKALLQAAFLNGAPHHSLGRPMKAGKEEIMGLLTAVEAWVHGRDHAAEWRAWEGYLQTIAAAVADLPSISLEVEPPGSYNVAPTLAIRWDAAALGMTSIQAQRALWEGEPRIALHLLPDGLRIMPYMMEQGDDALAAACLRQVLSSPPRATEPAPSQKPPCADVSGDWELCIQYVLGESHHALRLQQRGAEVTGRYRSAYEWVDLEGALQGAQIAWCMTLGYQSNVTTYDFQGGVEGDIMAGRVALGEYGSATWRAQRLLA